MSTGRVEPNLRWEAGPAGEVPVSVTHADPYYSRTDGLAEARHVFLAGNRLAERWRMGVRSFHIGELGFGTGLNVLAAWDLWRRSAPADAVLDVTSFELSPLPPDLMRRALAAFPAIMPLAGELLAAWRGVDRVTDLGSLRLRVITGDVRRTLPRWQGRADAWFLDGFAPARNPEMWEETLLAALAVRTAPGGTVATYSAAGRVRRALDAAGFDVIRQPGFGGKREMIAGVLAHRAPGHATLTRP